MTDKHYEGLNPVLFGYQSCEPNHQDGPAIRNYWLIHYVSSGAGIFEINNTTYNINAGEMFVIPPYEVYYYKSDEKNPWEYTWIGFNCSSSMPIKLPYVIKCPAAGDIFKKIRNAKNMDSEQNAYLTGMLWMLISVLLVKKTEHSTYVQKAIDYINNGINSEISVNKIAEQLNISRNYFFTLFKKEMGISPQDYIISLRMEHAKKLLIELKQTPTIVSNSLGFTNICDFSRAFKKYYGLSPREFVKKESDFQIEHQENSEP